MKDILDYISTWSILKWVILVLVAGFIGQFGKMLAEAIIAKARRRKASQAQEAKPQPKLLEPSRTEFLSPSAPTNEISDKKKLKALAKARKKEAKLK
jgi:hypothetical protein